MQQRRQELTDGVMACVLKPLRFAIGGKILARTGEYTYSPGKVIAYWYGLSPHQIKLDEPDSDGSDHLIHAPDDDDVFIMAAGSAGAARENSPATVPVKLSKKAKQKARQ